MEGIDQNNQIWKVGWTCETGLKDNDISEDGEILDIFVCFDPI